MAKLNGLVDEVKAHDAAASAARSDCAAGWRRIIPPDDRACAPPVRTGLRALETRCGGTAS